MKVCKHCDIEFENKTWGYVNVCEDCDIEDEPKSMGVMIADGKTDYHTEIVRKPTKAQQQFIKQVGRAWDPRTQLVAINKVSD